MDQLKRFIYQVQGYLEGSQFRGGGLLVFLGVRLLELLHVKKKPTICTRCRFPVQGYIRHRSNRSEKNHT